MTRADLLSDPVDAIVFDVIGTLVDDEGGCARVAERLAAAAGFDGTTDLNIRWTDLLERRMAAVVNGDSPWRPHQQLVNDSAHEALEAIGGNLSASAVTALVGSLDSEYPAWPDVARATAALRRSRLVAGVSNGDIASLARLANTNAISWDTVLSSGAVRTFKPAPEAYQYAISELGIDPARTLFVASHPWDLRAASTHGFRTAYIGRPGAQPPAAEDRFDLAARDLHALAAALGVESGSN